MTDRQVGGEGLNVDINAPGERRIGAEALLVDVMPPFAGERQTNSLGITIDFTYPQGVQYGSLQAVLDVLPSHPSTQLGQLGVLVDYVYSAAPITGEVSWNIGAFRLDHSGVAVTWAPDVFGTSGSQYVDWDETIRRFTLTP